MEPNGKLWHPSKKVQHFTSVATIYHWVTKFYHRVPQFFIRLCNFSTRLITNSRDTNLKYSVKLVSSGGQRGLWYHVHIFWIYITYPLGVVLLEKPVKFHFVYYLSTGPCFLGAVLCFWNQTMLFWIGPGFWGTGHKKKHGQGPKKPDPPPYNERNTRGKL